MVVLGGSFAVRNPQKELMSARWPRAGAASLARWIGQLRGGEPSHEESRSMPPSQRDQARSRRASGWSQLLITANGLEKPPAARCSSNTAPVHDPMEFGHGRMPRACPNSIRSCAEAILELCPSKVITALSVRDAHEVHPVSLDTPEHAISGGNNTT